MDDNTSIKVRKSRLTEEEIEEKKRIFKLRENSYLQEVRRQYNQSSNCNRLSFAPAKDVQFDVFEVSDLNEQNQEKLKQLKKRGYTDENVLIKIRKYDTSVLDCLLGSIWE